MSDYSIKDHIAYSMGFKDGKESQSVRIAELEAALANIRDFEPERQAWSVGVARAALKGK